MNLKKNIIFLYYIYSLTIIYALSCSKHCLQCKGTDFCTKCEYPYKLLGTAQNTHFNNITCTNQDLSAGYYHDKDYDVYYSCENSDYGYEENDDTKCYLIYIFGSGDYYTENNKNFYKCEDKIEKCSKCVYTDGKVLCTECWTNYVFVNNNNSICHSIDSLDQSYYKKDNKNYVSCNIEKCQYCSDQRTCIKCIDDYYTIYKKLYECKSESEIVNIDEYYLDKNTYYPCNHTIKHCQKCYNNSDHCIECQNGFAILDGNYTKCNSTNNLKDSKKYFTNDTGTNYYSCINNCEECEYDENSSTYKCVKCKANFAFLNENTEECFKIVDLKSNNHYYKENKTHYKDCSSSIANCETCKNKTHCITCENESSLGVLYGKFDECININNDLSNKNIFRENNYYYNCSSIIGCKRCENRSYCIEAFDNNYCLLNNKPIKLNKKNDLYFLSSQEDENHNTCKPCNSAINKCVSCSSEDNCYQCESGYTIVNNNTKNCSIVGGYKYDDKYFTTDNGRTYFECGIEDLEDKYIENCEKCEYNSITQKNNCKKCKAGFIILDDDGSNCLTITDETISRQISENKITGDINSTKYYHCNIIIPNCDECENKTYCRICKEDFIFLRDDQSKCLDKINYTNGHFFTNNSKNYYPCLDNCLECNNEETCKICDEGYEMNDFNNSCELILLDDNDIKKNCIYITKKINEERYDNLDFNITIQDLFNDYYSSFNKTKNNLVKYISNKFNFTVLIYKNDQCSLHLYEDNIFKINSSEIINELKKYDDSKDIIQVILIYKNNTAILFYSNKSGKRINIQDDCPACLLKKYKIVNNYKNKLTDDIGEKFAELISDKDIDIFNEKSEFFQTFCTDLQIEGIDIPLNIRNFLLYKGNLSYNLGDFSKGDLYACNVECSLVNNNPKNLSSECECELNYDIINFKTVVDKKE